MGWEQTQTQPTQAWFGLRWLRCNLESFHSYPWRQTVWLWWTTIGVFWNSWGCRGCFGLFLAFKRPSHYLSEKGRKTWSSLLPPSCQGKLLLRSTTKITQHGLRICWVSLWSSVDEVHKRHLQKFLLLFDWMQTFWNSSRLKELATNHASIWHFEKRWRVICLLVPNRPHKT